MRFNHDNPEELAAAGAMVLQTHPHAVIATTDGQNRPWAVPVHQFTLPNGTVTWRSRQDARHSRNLRRQSQASVVIYSSTDEKGEVALFLEGTAGVVEGAAEVARIIHHRFASGPEPPSSGDYLGESDYRMYAFIPAAAWLTDDTHTKTTIDLSLMCTKLTQPITP
jgi:hypothetical protein